MSDSSNPKSPVDPAHDTSLRGGLEDYERDPGDKPPFVLTYAEVKLLGV